VDGSRWAVLWALVQPDRTFTYDQERCTATSSLILAAHTICNWAFTRIYAGNRCTLELVLPRLGKRSEDRRNSLVVPRVQSRFSVLGVRTGDIKGAEIGMNDDYENRAPLVGS
jgi:hypothetical protein